MAVITLELIIKSMAVGFLSAAPTGPSGVLVIRKTMDKGRFGGFLTGLGVTMSDAIYIFVTMMCLSMVLGYLEDPQIALVVKLTGAVLLMVFGISTVRNNPLASSRVDRPVRKDTLWHNTLSGFLVAVVNPLVVFIYMGMFAFFSVPIDSFANGMKMEVMLLTVAGDVCWWLLLTFLINRLRNRFDLRGIWMINRILGTALIIVSLGWFILLMIG